MVSDERTIQLLEEIRDLQREQTEEYRRVAGEALKLQRSAVERQETLGNLYRGALLAGGVIAVVIIIVIVYLLYVLSGYF